MEEQKNNQSNTGCVLNAVIIMLLLVLIVGVFGGGLLAEAGERSHAASAPSIPNIPAPAPETLNYQPSVQTFTEPAANDCPDPSQPYAGWEDGVGGVLPPCWTREQQNAYMRSH
jgi:hypothetical protein